MSSIRISWGKIPLPLAGTLVRVNLDQKSCKAITSAKDVRESSILHHRFACHGVNSISQGCAVASGSLLEPLTIDRALGQCCCL